MHGTPDQMQALLEMISGEAALQLAVGSAVLAIAAYLRFGTTELRSQTTALRYHSTAVAYCLMALFLYYLVALSPALAVQVSKAFFTVELPARIHDMMDKLPPPVFALLLVLALPQVPKVSVLDRRVREYFQRLANIPFQAQLLSERLLEASFTINDDLGARLRKRLEERAFSADDIDNESEIARKWRRLSAICLEIERLKSREQYRAFHAHCAKSMNNTLARWDLEMSPAREAIRRRREVESLRGDLNRKIEDEEFRTRIRQEIDEILRGYEAGYLYRLDGLLKQVCDLLSRAILMSFRTSKSRTAAITGFGFDMRRPVGISGDQVVFTTLLILVTICGVLALKEYLWPTDGKIPILALAALVTGTHVIAVGFAVLSQRAETINSGAALYQRPYLHYLRIGLLAAALSAPLPATAILIVQASGGELPAIAFVGFLPICLFSCGSAAITAFNIDNGVMDRPSWAGRIPVERFSEAVGQGVAEATWTFLIISLVLHPTTAAVGLTPESLMGNWLETPPPRIFEVPLPPLIVQFVVGCIVGYFVPTMYREAYTEVRSRAGNREAGAPAVITAASVG